MEEEAKDIAYFLPVAFGALTSMISLFSLVGIFGVCAFPGRTMAGDVLSMLGDGAFGTISHIAFGFALICSAPLIVHPARASILGLLVYLMELKNVGGERDPEERAVKEEDVDADWLHHGVTTAIIITAATIAICVRDVMAVFGLMGSFICSPLFYFFPALLLVWLEVSRVSYNPALTSRNPAQGDCHITISERGVSVGIVCMCLWLIVVGLGTWGVSVAKVLAL